MKRWLSRSCPCWWMSCSSCFRRMSPFSAWRMAVVKAGAYGHGLEDVSRALSGEDIVFFGVANVGDALAAQAKIRFVMIDAPTA